MFFMRLWYSFLDKMNDRKFKTVFITSCVSLVVLVAVVIGIVVIVNKDKEASSPAVLEDNDTVLINGIDVTGKSLEEIEELFNEIVQEYSLEVLFDGKKAGIINGSDIDLRYNSECGLESYLEGKRDIEDTQADTETEKTAEDSSVKDTEEQTNNIIINDLLVYSEEKLDAQLEDIIADLDVAKLTADLVDIVYSEVEGYSLSIPEDTKFINNEAVETRIKLALGSCSESVDVESDTVCFADVNAMIEADERLKNIVDTLNLYSGSVLNYDFNGQLMVIDKAKTNSWFYLDENFNVNVDEDAVQIYANKLAEDFTDYSGTLQFLTSYGSYVNFRTASSNQVDIDTLFAYLVEDVKKGTAVNRTIPYVDTGLANADSTFGGTYVEINLTKQHLFFYYQGNLIVDCDIVSGSVDKGYATPGGIFTLRYKKKDATLNGADYSTPVDYWMPFNGGIGMHDANWRTEFGGSIYLEDGSHGCINMPDDAVAKVFEYAYAGMYVIVYGGAYSLDDAAAQEALNPETTEVSTEDITEAVTIQDVINNITNVTAPSATVPDEQPVLTEAVTVAVTETQAATMEETQPITSPETLPAETETSGENITVEQIE